MSMKGFRKWDKDRTDTAVDIADMLITDYNISDYDVDFTIPIDVDLVKYTMKKVWIILSGSGIFLDYKVIKKKQKSLVVGRMSEQLDTFIDSSDDEIDADDSDPDGPK